MIYDQELTWQVVLQQCTRILKGEGHVPTVWVRVDDGAECMCTLCGAAFRYNAVMGILGVSDLGKHTCPAGEPTVKTREVQLVIRGPEDVVDDPIATTHPLLPPGVTWFEEVEWVVSPEGDDMWPVIGHTNVMGNACPGCESTNAMAGLLVKDKEEKKWALCQCPGCGLYVWFSLHPKEEVVH